MEEWLNAALDLEITEFDFWNMTLAELDRLLESKARIQKKKDQEKAYFDYILADLIGFSISRIYSDKATYPEIYDVYPAIFNKDAILEARELEKEKKTNDWLLSFAEAFNKEAN